MVTGAVNLPPVINFSVKLPLPSCSIILLVIFNVFPRRKSQAKVSAMLNVLIEIRQLRSATHFIAGKPPK
jgi:hypothetical protein